MHPDTTLVIPQRGHADLTLACLRSLRDCEAIHWPIIVVDDGSQDDSAARIEAARLPNVTLFRQPHLGVSAAWNQGARHARTRYVLFLNNDVVTLGPWVSQLVRPLREGRAHITGAAWREERQLPADILKRLPTQRFLQGWCFALAHATFEELDGFDTNCAIYWSDTDLQARLWQQFPSQELEASHVANFPLKHLGHCTAHDPVSLPERRRQWRADRAAFIQKWRAVIPANSPCEPHSC